MYNGENGCLIVSPAEQMQLGAMSGQVKTGAHEGHWWVRWFEVQIMIPVDRQRMISARMDLVTPCIHTRFTLFWLDTHSIHTFPIRFTIHSHLSHSMHTLFTRFSIYCNSINTFLIRFTLDSNLFNPIHTRLTLFSIDSQSIQCESIQGLKWKKILCWCGRKFIYIESR